MGGVRRGTVISGISVGGGDGGYKVGGGEDRARVRLGAGGGGPFGRGGGVPRGGVARGGVARGDMVHGGVKDDDLEMSGGGVRLEESSDLSSAS